MFASDAGSLTDAHGSFVVSLAADVPVVLRQTKVTLLAILVSSLRGFE